jgi:hypothetical protein
MTQGEGLIGFFYAIKGMLEAGVMWLVTGFAVIAFFLIIVNYVGGKFGFSINFGKKDGGLFAGGKKLSGGNIVYALFLLFVIFAIYSLIALTGAVFGVNSGPAGGLLIR